MNLKFLLKYSWINMLNNFIELNVISIVNISKNNANLEV